MCGLKVLSAPAATPVEEPIRSSCGVLLFTFTHYCLRLIKNYTLIFIQSRKSCRILIKARNGLSGRMFYFFNANNR